MSSAIYRELAWLPRPPADFRVRLKALASHPSPWTEAVWLAGHALSTDQLTLLSKSIRKLPPADGAAPLRLGLIGNGTLSYAADAILGASVRHGLHLTCIQGEYDQALQDSASPGSKINTARPDAVLIAIDHRGLPLRSPLGDDVAADAAANHAADHLARIAEGVRRNGGALPILQTLAAPPEALFGALDRGTAGTPFDLVQRVNRRLVDVCAATGAVLLDVARLAETVGVADWHDERLWNLAKVPVPTDLLPLYADTVARTLAAIRGKSRKVLVLDLDNTVWGGVIGDDGLEGIMLAQGDATGEAHLAVQRYALALRERGVVLAVSSKNDDQVARAAFRNHPEMLLKEHHIAVFQANWQDKATNIQAIAAELSLGLDSIVLLDDNPMERDLVRRMLPQVAAPELPQDPALFARTLAAAGYFEAVAFSDEDRARADFYQSHAKRATLQAAVGDLESYLASLEMEITFRPFDAASRARIAQLINKSNQFNLTTRRYTEAEVAELERDPSVFTLQVRLTDVFGDNGMISVVVCRQTAPDTWVVDTWLMSCRVLGRNVEQMVLRELLVHARRQGIDRILGIFRPSGRNGMVEDHYSSLGFVPAEASDGETAWSLAVTEEAGPELMSVQRAGFELEPT